MNCPSCETDLLRIKYAGINVFHCPKCEGHLVEKNRVKTIERRIDADVVELSAEVTAVQASDIQQEIRCPRCKDRMEKKDYAPKLPFKIDECRTCDFVWLDGNELAQIQIAYATTDQSVELKRMRNRIDSMTTQERQNYESNIANLKEHAPELEIASALNHRIIWGLFRFR